MGGETTWEPTDPLLERLRHDLARRDGITVDVARLKYPDRTRPWRADRNAAAKAHGHESVPEESEVRHYAPRVMLGFRGDFDDWSPVRMTPTTLGIDFEIIQPTPRGGLSAEEGM